MSTAHVPRFLPPRGIPSRPSRSLTNAYPRPFHKPSPLHQTSYSRHASTSASTSTTPSKPRVLEKPTKFNPPSHPARLNRPPPRQFPGPPLSDAQKAAQKTKKYPHMMPAEGTFMHWFLTNRSIHVWITLVRFPSSPPTRSTTGEKRGLDCTDHKHQGTLFSLSVFTFLQSFHRTSPFAHMLPSFKTFFSRPLAYIGQYIEVYKLHTAHITAQTADRRRKKVEDVQKRAEYRKAHGLDKEEGFGGWMAKGVGEEIGPALVVEGIRQGEGRSAETGEVEQMRNERESEPEGVYVDFEGRKKPVRKWLGIW